MLVVCCTDLQWFSDFFNRENLILDCLFGVVVVVLCVIGFISLVWLKDQLLLGDVPQWLLDDRENAKAQYAEYERWKCNNRNEAKSNFSCYIKSCRNLQEHQCLSSDIHELENLVDVRKLHIHSLCIDVLYICTCSAAVSYIILGEMCMPLWNYSN